MISSRALAIAAIAAGCHPHPGSAPADPVATFAAGGLRLRVEALRDDLVHFELSPVAAAAPTPIATSPMVADRSAPIAWARRDATALETREIRVEVVAETLCVRVTDLVRQRVLHHVCPAGAAHDLTISKETTQHVYGLGEQFQVAGTSDGDWLGRDRTPGNEFGNAMVKFDGNGEVSGSVGNAQFPVLYALSPGHDGYALFVDDPHAERWSFRGDPWTLHSGGDALRWYVMTGPDVRDLRRDYMRLVGRPPVPPKQAFGLWISEYGFDNWKELEDKLATLRAHHFPVDGFVLDLQWFGNILSGSETSRMGSLTWDTTHFPDPDKKLKELRDRGIGLMVIEESYVARGLPEHADLAGRGFLARESEHGPPTFLTAHPWWGVGGMLDWSNRAGADYWHDLKRQPLVDAGVLGHWCDLGEPEMFSPTSWYAGGRQADVHNLFSLLWVESIVRGYQRHHVERRPFVMARSGAPGIARYGASMWSGDIGSNLTTLATHLNAQLHMSMSGIDYFGSDIGGFNRDVARGDLNDTYTQWFADGMAIDVPGRVHTRNLENDRETAPDRVGDIASNLASVRRRYELVPYVYSLAHRAYATGDPVFPPLVWAFQEDAAARTLGGEKLIGDAVLVALVAKDRARSVDVYLPRGATWIDFDGDRRYDGGQWLRGIALRDAAGVLRLPMFARAGAIVPLAYVDDETWNALGQREHGDHHDELRARVFAAAEPTRFELDEDDGATIAYQRGEIRRTTIAQRADLTARTATVTIGAASGSYTRAPARRDAVIDIVLPPGAKPHTVTIDGAFAAQVATADACERTAFTWTTVAGERIRIRAGEAAVTAPRAIVVSW